MKPHIEKVKNYIGKRPVTIMTLAFLGLALWGFCLDFVFIEPQWIFINAPFGKFLAEILINIAPELVGIAIGVFAIDYSNKRRQDEQLKRQLILQMGSSHNDVTDTAVRILRSYGWLTDGTLKGASLSGSSLGFGTNLASVNLYGVDMEGATLLNANLEEADMREANLSRANLWNASLVNTFLGGAKLEESKLSGTDLTNARLRITKMKKADLFGANLTKAKLWGANLEDAILNATNLERAEFLGANLKGVNLGSAKNWTRKQLLQAKSLEGAIMPDGRLYEEWILDDEEE